LEAVVKKDNLWWRIGGTLMIGLFVGYLDRTALSVALPSVARDLGFAGEKSALTSSWALTSFLIGYAFANVIGGILTRKMDPKKVVIWTFGLWSIATAFVGLTDSVAVLLVCRAVLGVGEGIYWPQQSRFAKAFFPPTERTRANAVIQYYGQFIALAAGFALLTPLYNAFGWRILFFIVGGIGFFGIVPLYIFALKPESQGPYAAPPEQIRSSPLTLSSLGGPAFLLLLFSYFTQGMLFWGITLWISLAVKSVGFTGNMQALASALPYIAAVLLAPMMTRISDRTGKRVLIAALGLLTAGILLMFLPAVTSGYAKLALITLSLGGLASTFTPNIWSILQSTINPEAIGPASGIMNGVGAGGGGTAAGFLVGLMSSATGNFMSGFVVLGALASLGGLALLLYGRIKAPTLPLFTATSPSAPLRNNAKLRSHA
jgi:MFS family permease